MKCIVVKGGWSWKGQILNVGDVIDGVSAEWIQNRVNDNGLVEPIAAPVAQPIETAAVKPAENATLPSQRESAKQRK